MKAEIIDRGRGPEIAGTRITVFDIMDYADLEPEGVAEWLPVSVDQIMAARRYIEEHRAELEPEYQEMLERDEKGNPPEVQERVKASHAKLMAHMEWLRQQPVQEEKDGRHPGGP